MSTMYAQGVQHALPNTRQHLFLHLEVQVLALALLIPAEGDEFQSVKATVASMSAFTQNRSEFQGFGNARSNSKGQ